MATCGFSFPAVLLGSVGGKNAVAEPQPEFGE
jgi:hypothetical protein